MGRQEVINEVARMADTDGTQISVAVVSRVTHTLFHVLSTLPTAEKFKVIGEFIEGAEDCLHDES